MKKLVLFFSLCILSNTTIIAQNFNFKGQTGILTKYVGPDGLLFYKNPVLQGNFTLGVSNWNRIVENIRIFKVFTC